MEGASVPTVNPCKHKPVRGIYFRPQYQAFETWVPDRNPLKSYFGDRAVGRVWDSTLDNADIEGGMLFICRKCWLVYAEPTRALAKDSEWQRLMDKVEDGDQ